MDLVLVKLGGSLLTDKTRPGHARSDVIERLATELAAARRAMAKPMAKPAGIVLGHGSGSFGHVEARRAGLNTGPPSRPATTEKVDLTDDDALAAGIAATQAAAAKLHRLVLDALVHAGARPFSLPPSAFLTTDAGRIASLHSEPLMHALDHGLLPVVYGDVVLDATWGACIRSTEHVLEALCTPLQSAGHTIQRALWLGETAGLLDAQGATVASLPAAQLDEWLQGGDGKSIHAPRGTDVTGGMELRLRTVRNLTARGIASCLLDGRRPGLLRQVLTDGAAAHGGTTIPGTSGSGPSSPGGSSTL